MEVLSPASRSRKHRFCGGWRLAAAQLRRGEGGGVLAGRVNRIAGPRKVVAL